MIGQKITSFKDGKPLDNNGQMLAESTYQPPEEVKKLFARVQQDYQIAYALQHRSWKEFDGYSLLDRARLDQELFGVYVGCEFVPQNRAWRWKGRKNTARNKIIGILATMVAGMIYPYVNAKNEDDEEDKMTAQVMRILIQDYLKKANYDYKFMFMVLSALVNPAVFVEVEFIEAFQMIKQRGISGKNELVKVVDELLTGLHLNVVPIDELMLADFYTGNIQHQPYIIRVQRIPWDKARKIYSGKYKDSQGKDLFDYVQAGKTRVVLTGNENQTLYDIEWTEADRDFVQVLSIKYRPEDLELTWVGGVGMFNETDVYNNNPICHRRCTLLDGKWYSIPIYNVAKSGFEPLDPSGRFAYYKSAAAKEFWDDAALNRMHQMTYDGTALEIFKPIFLSGVGKVDDTVMVPGKTVGMPSGATATPFSIGPNLKAGFDMMEKQTDDMADSTNDNAISDQVTPGVTATAIAASSAQARRFYAVSATMIADLVTQVGELTTDLVVDHATVGQADITVPEAMRMKYKTFLVKGKEKGKSVTNKVVFTDKYMGMPMTKEKKEKIEWDIYDKTGGAGSDQRLFLVNPFKFARTTYSMTVDPDEIMTRSFSREKSDAIQAFNIMTDPRVLPFIDPQAVIDDFVIDKFGGDNPDKYKKKGAIPANVIQQMMPQPAPGGPPKPAGAAAPALQPAANQ